MLRSVFFVSIVSIAQLVLSSTAICEYSAFEITRPPSVLTAFGTELSQIGDITGDGKPDFAVSNSGPGFISTGIVGIYSGADRSLLTTLIGTGAQDQFGYSISPLGDVNGDGVPDFIVGSPQQLDPYQCTVPPVNSLGRLNVISGSSFSSIYSILGSRNEGFGQKIAPLSDINNDNKPDFVVVVPSSRAGSCDPSNGTLVRRYSGHDGSRLGEELYPESGGRNLVNVGDVNRDGYSDYSVNIPFYTYGMQVASGKNGTGLLSYLGSSSSIAGLGDVNGDGFGDVAVLNSGTVTTYSGVNNSVIRTLSLTAATGDGKPLANIGDVDRDGINDLAVLTDRTTSIYLGDINIYSGLTGALLSHIQANNINLSHGIVSPLGDVDGDQVPDFLVGGAYIKGDTQQNRAYVLLSNTTNPQDPFRPSEISTSFYVIDGDIIVAL